MLTPSSRNWCRIARLVSVSARKTDSVISSSSRPGDRPDCASAEITTWTRLRLRNCTEIDRDLDIRWPFHRLCAPFAQHPFADRDYQADIFRDRNEIGGRDHALVRMPPAQQRFKPGDAVARDVDQRLIMQLEFAVGECAAKIEFHVAALLRLTVHFALEETMHAAAIFLRAVQSEIGVAHQLLTALAVTGRQRNPDGSADHHLVAVEIIWCAQDVDQARGEAARLIRRDVGGKDDRELVSSEPGCEIIAADLTAQPLGHELQQPITDRMAKRIIDVLEQVEINAEHRDALVATLTAFQRLLQALLVELAVGQIGQAVMMGHIGDAGFGLATLGDVDDGDKVAVTAAERDAPAEGKHLDFAAVGLQVPPVTGGAIGLADLAQRASPWLTHSSSGQIS